MNKRIKKKLNKRFGKKKYSEYRKEKLIRIIANKYNTKSTDLIHITTSNTGDNWKNLKQVESINIFRNVYPASINTTFNEGDNIDITFSTQPVSLDSETKVIMERRASYLNQMLEVWANGIKDPSI